METLQDQEKASPSSVESTSRLDLFLACIGYHELFSTKMWGAALAELVATTFLIFTLTTTILSCLNSHQSDPKLLIPIVVFLIAFLFLLVTIPLSGGHMSPVFTFIAVLKGLITPTRAAIYVLCQCIGSIISFTALNSVMDKNMAHNYIFGGCTVKSVEIDLILEFMCTFVVLFVGVTMGFEKRRCREHGLVMVCVVVAGSMGLAVFVSIAVSGEVGYAGVGLNPARCLGAALLHGGSLWSGHWVFWVGPFLSCVVYYGFIKCLSRDDFVMEDGEEYDFVNLARAWCFGIHKSVYPQEKK